MLENRIMKTIKSYIVIICFLLVGLTNVSYAKAKKVGVKARPNNGLDSDWITAKEKDLAEILFKPTPEQIKQKIRIAVWPILAAHITN